MNANFKLLPDQGKLLDNPERYRRFVSKLNYLTTTRPDVAYSVIVVSQFLSALWTSHRDDVIRIIWYLKCAPSIELLYSNYGHECIVRIVSF